MNQKALALQHRTRRFGADVITLCAKLPTSASVRKLVEQLVDSSGSTDSNYRAACRARSPKEFVVKIGVAAEEADESKGWLQLLVLAHLAKEDDCVALINEADELTRIFVASRKTAEKHNAQRALLRKRPRRKAPIDNQPIDNS